MSARAQQLCDAIVEALGKPSEPYVMAFEAERRVVPLFTKDIQERKTVAVSVFMGSYSAERVGRSGKSAWRKTYKPIIGVQRYLDGGTNEANEAIAATLIELVEQILHTIEQSDTGDFSLIRVNDETEKELYSADIMRSANIFATAITLEFIDGG